MAHITTCQVEQACVFCETLQQMSEGDDRPKEDGAGAKNTNHRR